MSSKDDESSQLEKLLLSSPDYSSPSSRALSTNRQTPDHSSGKTFIVSPVELVQNDEKSETKECLGGYCSPPLNQDRCYGWLKVPPNNDLGSKRTKSTSESSDISSVSSDLPMPAAPDGGWGWFVVLGAFLVTLICDGIAYSFGVLYSELLVQFGESRSKTSLVGSIFFGVAMILGPLASALTTRFGCRTMTIFGGILASIGFALSSFATSIDMLCFTFSIVVGTGFSFCYVTSVVIVAFYFDKKRALATGLAVCGTGVGTFSFAPLMDFLIGEYGIRGLFLIMSGICLNLVVCGMLFRPLHFTESERWHMLLQEFNKIPYSREDIELSRSRYPSDLSESDDDDEAIDEEQRTLSVLSLPTFVDRSQLDMSSSVLMEALKNSKNPHHTIQRYMRNAMLQVDHAKPNYDPAVGSPVDKKAITIALESSSMVKNADYLNTDNSVDNLPSSLLDETVVRITPDDKGPKISVPPSTMSSVKSSPAQLSEKGIITSVKPQDKDKKQISPKNNSGSAMKSLDTKTQTNMKSLDTKTQINMKSLDTKTQTKQNDTNKEREHASKRQEFSAMSGLLTNKGCEMEKKTVGKRLGGVHIGRHNVLGIHLPLYRTDIFYRRLLKHNTTVKHCTLGTSCPTLTESIAAETEKGVVCRKISTFLEDAGEIMRSMIEIRLFLNPFFVLFVISNFFFYFWSDIPYMYASDHAMDNGVEPRKASFLLSFIGIFNTIGQVVFGIVGDTNINLLNVYAIISSMAGIFIGLVPFMTSYVGMCVMYSLFGFFVSVSFPLTTVLLINYLGVAKLTNAYGLLMLMQGIANLFGPPFAGWVSDQTGTYNSTFYMSGSFYALAGMLLFLLYLPRCRDYRYSRPYRPGSDFSIEIEAPPSPNAISHPSSDSVFDPKIGMHADRSLS